MSNFAHLPKTSGVYKIINIVNNKCYVGSSVNLRKRCREHILRLRSNKHPNSYLQSSFNKYGEESFIFEYLEEVLDCKLLLRREGHFITLLCPEYNLALLNPEGYKTLSEETRKKIGIKSAEKFVKNPELIQKLAEARSLCPVWNKGKVGVYSQEVIEKMSKAAKIRNSKLPKQFYNNLVAAAKKNSELNKKPILQFDLSMNLVKEWDSLREAADFLGKSIGNIWSGIKYSKVRYGHYWKYKLK
jgi:group I intron endonuclease